jgi:hypothetical protein
MTSDSNLRTLLESHPEPARRKSSVRYSVFQSKSPSTALSASQDGTRAVVASKSEIKTLHVTDDSITTTLEVCQASRLNRLAAFKCVKWGYGRAPSSITISYSSWYSQRATLRSSAAKATVLSLSGIWRRGPLRDLVS